MRVATEIFEHIIDGWNGKIQKTYGRRHYHLLGLVKGLCSFLKSNLSVVKT